MLIGFSGIFGKLISLNEALLTWYRVSFSAVILYFVLKIFGINRNINLREKVQIAKTGMLITLSWLFFFASIKYSNVSIGVVCYCLASFYTALFEPIINKKSFKWSELLLSTLTVIGIGLIFHFDTHYKIGIILGVISPAFVSLYTIYNEKLVRKYDSKLINYYQMIGGTIGLGALLPFYLYFSPTDHLLPNRQDAFYLFLLASICTVGLYVTFAEVLKKIPAFTVNLSLNLEPVYAMLLAFILFHESKDLNPSFYLGMSLVVLSVVLQTVITVKTRK